MYQKYFIGSTIGIFLGICFAYLLNFSTQVFVVSFVICIVNLLIYKFSKRSFGVYKSETPIFLFMLFIFISIGILLGQYSLAKDISRRENFIEFISRNKNFTGQVVQIDKKEKSQSLIVLHSETTNSKTNKYKIRVGTSLFPEYKVGDIVKIEGKIDTENVLLPEVKDKINNSFDISLYNNVKDIDGQMSFPKIIKVSDGSNIESNVFYKIFCSLQNYKNKFVASLDKVSTREVSSLVSGVLLGDASLFSQDDIDAFRSAGLSHIIVLSGFNITVLIFFLVSIFLNLNIRLRVRVILSIVSIFFFIIFVGAGPSIVRAGIMGSVLLLASLFHRQYVARQALFLSAFVMMIINPKIAPYYVSFHLSFLATIGILYLVPILDNVKLFSKYKYENLLDKKLSVKENFYKNILEIIKVTLAVQILVLPYIMYTFGKISIFTLLANVLVLPVVPIVMLLGFFVITFSFLFIPLAKLLSLLTLIICKYIFIVARVVADLPFANLDINLSLMSLTILYLLIFSFVLFENKYRKINNYINKNN